ncbi:mucin-binding protein [Lactobacillus sp. PV034]|uniref:mucin-binding protein n=1 Tax=Lactobacillus sp. PV034 TaxID=2594495 RepID=UPI00223F6194|nr:MucBP domain-containing protein [Lactobacillus sp. PV034]QNQ81424.1 YSIRK-type signal peptide-containing protein [Lactobacillus sp. PV034]
MVSKNNKIKKMEQAAQRNNHFSIRKLTVGAASVLLGTSLYLGTQTSQAHAATADEPKEAVVVTHDDTSNNNQDIETKTTQALANTETAKANEVQSNQLTAKSADDQDSKAVAEAKAIQDAPATTNSEQEKATTKDAKNQTYKVQINYWNDAKNTPLTYTGKLPGNNGSFSQEVKAGDVVGILGMAPMGYKLLNPEAITSNFKMAGNVAYIDGHDVDITLHYAPLSSVYVEYVDEKTGKVLSTTGVGSNTSSSQSIANAAGDVMYPGTSKFLVHAIDIPGYELVSDPEYIGYYDQVQSADNANPIIVQFKYKKITTNEDPKDVKAGAEVDGQWFGPTWENLPGGSAVTGVYGTTYGEENGNLEEKEQVMINRYEKQGYTYVGTFNYHKNSDYYNFNEGGVAVNLIPNQPVTVYYEDKNGNQLATPTVIAQNPNNPDQTNNGIDESNHWHPTGDWKAMAKDIDGYVLDKTYGATEGKFVPYDYNVTFVYIKKEGKVPGDAPTVTNPEAAVITVNYIDQTDNNKVLASEKLAGEDGSAIDTNSVDTKIADYENEGYVLVSNGFEAAGKDFTTANNGKTYDVIFKHGTEPVNPNHPGKPGEPLNPKDPEAKFPDGTAKTDLEKTVTRTITYVASSQKDGYPFVAPKTVTQNVKFTAAGIIDKVTGNLVTVDAAGNITSQDGKLTWTPESSTLAGVTTPVVANYHVVSVNADSKDGVNVDAITVNHDSNNIDVVVTYAPNGHIIPVDPNGNPIPNVPVDTPPYTTDPHNPSKVVPNEPVPVIPGYIPDIPEVPGKDQTVPTPPNPSDDIKVPYIKKETSTMPPLVDTKPEAVIGQVAYIDDTTGKTLSTATIAGEVGQKIDYTTTGTITKYENEGYDFVSSDFVNGNEIFEKGGNDFTVHFKHGIIPVNPQNPGRPGEPLNPNDPEGNGPKYPDGTKEDDLVKDVTRTIKFVDQNGNEVAKTVTQPAHFTAAGKLDKVTGKWVTPLTWTPDNEKLSSVAVPVVEKQHVISIDKDDNGLTSVNGVTVNHDTESYVVTVTYAPNGHIIPVDPNGNPIPNVPVDTPPYPTDPTNPSKVVPNVPVPVIPGYIPDIPSKNDKVPTPPNPSDDIKVPYIKKETSTMPPLVDTKPEAAIDIIKYINDTTGETMSEVKVAGEVGSKVTYTTTKAISDYVGKGYKFVSSNFDNGNEVFVKGGQSFEVHFTQSNEPIEPNTPEDPNPTPQPHPQTPSENIPDEPTPEDPDVPMPHPQTPEVPEEPEDNTPAPHASIPEEPVSDDEGEVPVVHANKVDANDDVPMPHATQEALPQTGEKTTSAVGIIAGAIASVLGIIGLAGRRKEDK